MFTKKTARRLIDAAVKYARTSTIASGVEVAISQTSSATARFANSEMTQHLQGVTGYVAVRALVGGRTVVQFGDDYTAAGLRRLINKAVTLASELKHDARTYQLLKPRTSYTRNPRGVANRYDPRIARITADDRRLAVQKIIKVAESHELTVAGIYAPTTSVYAVGNTNGLYRFHQQSSLECSVTMVGATSSGWQKTVASSLDDVDVKSLAETAARKAIESKLPKAVEPGDYEVVLEPSAVLDLFSFLIGAFRGDSHCDQSSAFFGKAGKRVLGKNITITDNVYHELQTGQVFDDEGMTRKAVTLVKDGVFKQPVKSRRSAAYLGGEPTGHGIGLPGSENDWPVNLVVEGGDSTVQQMIESTTRGILLPRVWYLRDVDPNTLTVTGMTRDGAMLIENGKLTRGIKNMRFNVSLLHLFKHVTMLGESIFAAGEEGSPAVVPAMKVEDFRFTSRTK
jgi:PmbA protein